LLIVWAPLFVLSAIESLVLGENKLGSLIGDLTVLSRYLIAFFGSAKGEPPSAGVLALGQVFEIVRHR
jgi:hypothetical protein